MFFRGVVTVRTVSAVKSSGRRNKCYVSDWIDYGHLLCVVVLDNSYRVRSLDQDLTPRSQDSTTFSISLFEYDTDSVFFVVVAFMCKMKMF